MLDVVVKASAKVQYPPTPLNTIDFAKLLPAVVIVFPAVRDSKDRMPLPVMLIADIKVNDPKTFS